MRATEVLLREDVHHLGRVGDVVKVAAGYARNYLLPKGLAIPASAENKRALARRRERIEAEEAALAADTQAMVDRLAAVVLRTSQTADENGHLYGSVSAATIAELLAAAGHELEESRVRLDNPIKEVGRHTVLVHVRGDANAEIRVEVAPEGGELPPEGEPEAAAEEPAPEAEAAGGEAAEAEPAPAAE